jgi:hypothetical protein
MSPVVLQSQDGTTKSLAEEGANLSSKAEVSLTITTAIDGLICYALTSTIVVLGVAFGHRFLELPSDHPIEKGDLLSSFANYDGVWYKAIVTHGYTYDPDKRSSVAFFPVFPLLVASLMQVTNLGPDLAFLIVSHACLAALFVLVALYLRPKMAGSMHGLTTYVLLSMGLMPATLFFRMAYSESLFVLLSVLVLFGMERRWPLLVIALIIGFATAVRPVGIGLLAPFLLHCWHRSSTRRNFIFKTVGLLPIAIWGIAAYAAYQHICFNEPFAFVKAQSRWGFTHTLLEKLHALLSYKPFRDVYDPFSPAFWGSREAFPRNPFFSWAAVNPPYFALAVILVLIGAWQRWLSSYEVTMAAALLLIPYCTRSDEMGMASHARFAAAVFPVYLVLGNVLARLPGVVTGSLLGVSAFYLGIFSALFATWRGVY